MEREVIRNNYALYNGDCVDVMGKLPDNTVDFIIYSPPFNSMYTYSSDDRDMGNNITYEEFLTHYEFAIIQTKRLLKPGRLIAVHCMDIPKNGDQGLVDFPGDIIRLHQKHGLKFWDRKNIWKEPLRVAIRTRQKALMHMQLAKDTSKCRGALADYLLVFRNNGDNETPIEKPVGLTEYYGDTELMNKEERQEYFALKTQYINYTDDKTNRLSQFLWRRYASSSWEDIRAQEVCQYKPGRDKDDDRHVCPLQLDIIRRSVVLYTNENEIVLTPFMGVGSELYAALELNRKGIGIELKPSYFRQAAKNLEEVQNYQPEMIQKLF